MSSLRDSLVDDLDDLDDDDNDDDYEGNSGGDGGGAVVASESKDGNESGDSDEEGEEDAEDDADIDQLLSSMIEIKKSNSVGILRASNKYKEILKNVRAAVESPCNFEVIGVLENDPEYKLILQCNKLVLDIDDDIAGTHRFVAELYSSKFPELDNLVQNKLDYVRIVQRIGNEMDMTVVDLSDILHPNLVMVVSVSGSTTSGKPLSPPVLSDCMRACSEVLQMSSEKVEILQFIESRMVKICPNVCCLVGSRVAAQMVGLAGGIVALSKIPSCNIQVMGHERKNLAGLSVTRQIPHLGSLYFCDTVQKLPSMFRKRATKLIAAKVALMARVDAYKNHADGSEGNRMSKDVESKIAKWLEPSKSRTKKALPIPQEKKRKSKRGGKRVRRLKERFGMTEIRSLENKMKFSTDVGEYGDSAMGFDRGMVGLGKDSGRLRTAQPKEVKFHTNKKLKTGNSNYSINANNQINGLATSLAFTPVQGLELANPNAMSDKVKDANKKWFNSSSGFLSAMPK